MNIWAQHVTFMGHGPQVGNRGVEHLEHSYLILTLPSNPVPVYSNNLGFNLVGIWHFEKVGSLVVCLIGE